MFFSALFNLSRFTIMILRTDTVSCLVFVLSALLSILSILEPQLSILEPQH